MSLANTSTSLLGGMARAIFKLAGAGTVLVHGVFFVLFVYEFLFVKPDLVIRRVLGISIVLDLIGV